MSFTQKTDRLNEVYDKYLKEETAYQKFFKKKLKAYGVKSPSELDDAKKKKFFDEIKKEWKGDKE